MNAVTRLDIEKYRCVSDKMTTEEVVITEERIQHIRDRHPLDYEKISFLYTGSNSESRLYYQRWTG